jgi:hypothetical protein
MMTSFKLLRVRKDGSLGPLFINRKQVIPVGEWLMAEEYPTKGFAFRPGWHTTHAPYAPHLSMKNRRWFEVEIKGEKIFQRSEKFGGTWLISKWMKVVEPVDRFGTFIGKEYIKNQGECYVYEFEDDEKMIYFLDRFGGMSHPLGGRRVVITERVR